MVEPFADIRSRAEDRQGGAAAVEARLADLKDLPTEPAAFSDDRVLAEMTKRIFQSGFAWSVIENKWPGFEEAFAGFDVETNAEMDAAKLDALCADTRIVRNKAKIVTVRDNAQLVARMAAAAGSAGCFIAEWDENDQTGLTDYLKKNGNRLGGNTGQIVLRFLGKDGFVLSKDVVTALKSAGVVDGPVTSKKAQAAIQDAFNGWVRESGKSRVEISRTLALSVG